MTHQDYRDYVTFKCRTPEECSLMGLVGEVGEIIDYLKKVQYHGHQLDRKKLGNEFGDLLFYITDVARRHDVKLEELAVHDVEPSLKKLLGFALNVWQCSELHISLRYSIHDLYEQFCCLLKSHGFTIGEVMLFNKEKLDARYKAGFTPEESQKRADKA